jgi:hypothetical protein
MGMRGWHAVQTMQPPTRIRCSTVWTQMSPRRSGVSVTKRCERADAHRKCQMPFKCANFFKRRHADTAAASAADPSKLRMNRTVKSSIGEKTPRGRHSARSMRRGERHELGPGRHEAA